MASGVNGQEELTEIMEKMEGFTVKEKRRKAVSTWDDEKLASGINGPDELADIMAKMKGLTVKEKRRRIVYTLLPAVDRRNDEKLGFKINGHDELSEIMAKTRNLTAKIKGKRNRCERCNKKVGLLGFRCRCGGLFCGKHRMPEIHTCEVDYKTINSSYVNLHLTLVKPDKLEFRI